MEETSISQLVQNPTPLTNTLPISTLALHRDTVQCSLESQHPFLSFQKKMDSIATERRGPLGTGGLSTQNLCQVVRIRRDANTNTMQQNMNRTQPST